MADKNQIETAAKLASDALRVADIITAHDGREFLVVPNDMKSTEITPPNAPDVLMPKLVTQHVKLQTVESLNTYVNRFKNFDTALFANIDSNVIHAIIDYHKMPAANKDGGAHDAASSAAIDNAHDAAATLARHSATLCLPYSQEWTTWNDSDEDLMSHREFATFLEENQVDITSPPGGDLLELCRDLQVINNVNFQSSVRNGDYNTISFSKQNDATTRDEVQLPLSIKIKIPVYFGEPPVEVTAFMRRKINDGELLLGYKLSRAENIRQDEFHRIVGTVAGTVECTTLYGTPA
jgi:uncharacterized protein YfdQ (DUF2303 family)